MKLLPPRSLYSYQIVVPLEVHFVLTPKLNIGAVHPLAEVFKSLLLERIGFTNLAARPLKSDPQLVE
jgi:hypothetical protein